jgi:spermidine synthase
VAALSWEVLWQHFTALALGVSAAGAAITLAITMAGMTVGSLAAGRWWQRAAAREKPPSPIAVYGALELSIGVVGQALEPGFALIADVEASVFASSPGLAWLVQSGGILLLLGAPALAMGATIPTLGFVARRTGASLSRLYAFNVLGASAGVLALAFVLVPAVGVSVSVGVASLLNVIVGGSTLFLARRLEEGAAPAADSEERAAGEGTIPFGWSLALAALTGWATFVLEVAWFRAFRAAFHSSTTAFALMLFGVLLPLSLGAHAAPLLRRRGFTLGSVLVLAALLALVSNVAVDRFDQLVPNPTDYGLRILVWGALSLLTLGPPVALLGVSLPWLLDDARGAREWAALYAINTAGAVVGSLGGAFVLLPALGVAATGRVTGLVVGGVAALAMGRRRAPLALGLAMAFIGGVMLDSGAGNVRARWRGDRADYRLLTHREGPDVTTSVVEHREEGLRVLLIDGFPASADAEVGAHYMPWMGHLPMALVDDPERALVICFGTGQTAYATWSEKPRNLDIVDVNAAVFGVAHSFEAANHGVLEKSNVNPVVMDGRAWLRRTQARYDVITLEPMPPHHAGVNALYSQEFYALARSRLRAGGVVAQWLPFHLVTPEDAVAIAAAFRAELPDSLLWIDPPSGTGILVGRTEPKDGVIGTSWPGFAREVARDMTREETAEAVWLDAAAFERYASYGAAVTDDNQLLAYGSSIREWSAFGTRKRLMAAHRAVLERARAGSSP